MLSAPVLAVTAAAGVGAVYFGLRTQWRQRSIASQYNDLTAHEPAHSGPGAGAPLIIRLLGDLGTRLQHGPARRLLGHIDPRHLRGLDHTLRRAGNPWGLTAHDLVAMQTAGGLLGAAAGAWAITLAGIAWPWGLPIGALTAAAPRTRINETARLRTTAIRQQLPNFLDLLIVNHRAGQPLQRGFELAGAKLAGPLAAELRHVAALLRVGETEHNALLGLAQRTGIDEMHRLAAALITALRYGGAGFDDSLALLATQIRTEWRQTIQTRIERTKVLLWIPLSTCLIPAFVLLLIGPAIIHITTEL